MSPPGCFVSRVKEIARGRAVVKSGLPVAGGGAVSHRPLLVMARVASGPTAARRSRRHGQSAWVVQAVSLQSLLLGSRLRGNQKLKLLGEVEFCPGKTTAPLPNCSADPHWHELGFVHFKCGRNLKAVMQIACLVPLGAREPGRWLPVLQALRLGPPRLTSCARLRLSRLTDKTPSVSSLKSGPQATCGIAEGRGQRSGAGLELWFFGQWCGTGS